MNPFVAMSPKEFPRHIVKSPPPLFEWWSEMHNKKCVKGSHFSPFALSFVFCLSRCHIVGHIVLSYYRPFEWGGSMLLKMRWVFPNGDSILLLFWIFLFWRFKVNDYKSSNGPQMVSNIPPMSQWCALQRPFQCEFFAVGVPMVSPFSLLLNLFFCLWSPMVSNANW